MPKVAGGMLASCALLADPRKVSAETSTITGDPTNGTTTYTYDALARLARLARLTRAGLTTSYGWPLLVPSICCSSSTTPPAVAAARRRSGPWLTLIGIRVSSGRFSISAVSGSTVCPKA